MTSRTRKTFLRTNYHHLEKSDMCEAFTGKVGEMVAANRDKQNPKKKTPSLLISENDSEGRPVGIGGKRRREDIDAIVNGASTGLQIPGQ